MEVEPQLNQEPTEAGGESPPPPRAFAQGTGLVLQVVGGFLFFTTCCLCSSSFLWDPIQSPHEALQLIQSPQSALGQPGKTGLMLTIMTMSIGGLSLATFGLGLQSDRRRAAWGATITITLMLLMLIAAGVGLWSGTASWSARVGHGVVFLIVVALQFFCMAALRQVLAAPPPIDVDIIAPGTKIPYNFYHDDPPEVRLAKELAQRREQLAQEQGDLDKMEQELKDRDES